MAPAEPRADLVRLGDSTSCERVRAGDQRPRHAILPSLPVLLHQCAPPSALPTFLTPLIATDPEEYDVSALPPSVLEALEADSFWCLSKLLDGIQDNYIFAQPGIQRQVARMKELCSRVDGASSRACFLHRS